MSAAAAQVRLGLMRALGWALLIGGWLVLGVLGREILPRWAGGQAPLALWLAVMGGAVQAGSHRAVGPRLLRGTLVVSGLATAWLLWRAGGGGGAACVWAAAVGWGVLLVGVSRSVRALRHGLPQRPGRPVLPALAGAAAAWWSVGDLQAVQAHAVTLAVAVTFAALACALLAPARAPRWQGCRGGLFDCALPAPSLSAWRRPVDWPSNAASLAMLPMMLSLPAMSDWCSGSLGGAAPLVALHLAVMLLPASCCGRCPRAASSGLAAGLLGAGLLALWLRPGLAGLMAASLLHAAAWSIAWSATMRPAETPPPAASSRPGRGSLGSVMFGPLAALLLGTALAEFGPAALIATHAGLAVIGIAGLAGAGIAWLIRLGPAVAARPARFTSSRVHPAAR